VRGHEAAGAQKKFEQEVLLGLLDGFTRAMAISAGGLLAAEVAMLAAAAAPSIFAIAGRTGAVPLSESATAAAMRVAPRVMAWVARSPAAAEAAFTGGVALGLDVAETGSLDPLQVLFTLAHVYAASGGGGGGGRRPPHDPVPDEAPSPSVARPPARTLQSSPPPPPSNAPGPKPVTDVEIVRANVSAPSSIKPQDPATHQADWQARGGLPTQKAPPAYRDGDGNVRVRTDHPLLAPVTDPSVGVPAGQRRGPHVFTKRGFGGSPPPVSAVRAGNARQVGLADTGQAQPPAKPAADPLSKTPAAPVPAPGKASNIGLDDTGQAPPQATPAPNTGASGATSGPRGAVGMVQPVSLDRVQKLAKVSPGQVKVSASAGDHANGWRFNGGDPEHVPIAFIVGKTVFVDPTRWPKDRPLPK
jgi:hypothetical protein